MRRPNAASDAGPGELGLAALGLKLEVVHLVERRDVLGVDVLAFLVPLVEAEEVPLGRVVVLPASTER